MEELVKALLDGQAYPHQPPRVELAQTQMSLVFLTGRWAYKVKKPVNLGYLDYTTLEKRLFFCQQEVRLNRRLCPEVYLGVVPVVRQGQGLLVEEEGEVVEYAVKMLQLPIERMMDVLLDKNLVTEEMVQRVADRMAQFHSQAETSPAISAFGSLEAIRTNTQENFIQTEKYKDIAITAATYQAIQDYTNNFMRDKAGLFQRRVRQGHIRDCHGDLHAAHVCFSDGLCIYDCIEFNDRFRYGDVASEIAFLAMDLDFHGRPDLSRFFIKHYVKSSGDRDLYYLMNFYKIYRAYVRGKVDCFRMEDPLLSPRERDQALQRAQAYFDLALSYLQPRPWLIITTGLTGTGKSALAQALGQGLGLKVLSSDVVRKSLAGIPIMEHHFESFDTGLYAPDITRRTYDTLFQEADSFLAEGKSVILDATFRRQEERSRAQGLARERGASFWILEVTCPEEIVRKRLATRLKQATPSDGRWEVYLAQKEDFDPVAPGPHRLVVDASPPLSRVVAQALRLLPNLKQSPRRRQ